MKVHVLYLDACIEHGDHESTGHFQQVLGPTPLECAFDLQLAVNQVVSRVRSLPPGTEWSLSIQCEIAEVNPPDQTQARWKQWLANEQGLRPIKWTVVALPRLDHLPTSGEAGNSGSP